MKRFESNNKTAQPFDESLFTRFFETGMEESKSPFLTSNSRRWAENLPLKASFLAAFFLLLSFSLSFSSFWLPLSQFLLVFVYFLVGTPALIEAIEDLACFEVNIDVLMTLAAFSSVFIGSGLEGGLLLVLFALSGAMEEAVTAKAKDAISSLHKLTPTKACVLQQDGSIVERALSDVRVEMSILVRAGELVPLDGIVIEGESSVNLAHLTGESIPVVKKVGDEVAAGAQNMEGALSLRVLRTSAESTLTRIISLVTQAQEAKPKLQRWFDRLSSRYAVAIILFSFLSAISMPFLLSIPFLGEEGALYRSLAFLIAASPCALILAIPIAYLSAISTCARNGILLKGGIALDALAQCSAIGFDKTGTLTTGKLVCLGIEKLGQSSDKIDLLEPLACAYALEQKAFHPVAEAIVRYVETFKTIKPVSLRQFRQVAGSGVQGVYEKEGQEEEVYLGHVDYIANRVSEEIKKNLIERSKQVRSDGELLAVLLIGDSCYLFRFADELRKGVAESLAPLRDRWGLRLSMLTGDHEANARRTAQLVGLESYYADLRPEDKLRLVSELSRQEGLAMVGDGINDAPALARATVGICMGQVGSATAIEAADIVLLHDNIDKLSWLMGKATLTRHIVVQNVVLASVALVGASLLALGGYVPLWLAVILHEGGTVLVGLNALRLLRQ